MFSHYYNCKIYYSLYINSMIRHTVAKMMGLTHRQLSTFSSISEGKDFLVMVEKYFDKAGSHTGIRPDYLNFYKKADNVVKFNLTLVRGTFHSIKMTTALKSFLLIDANIRHTNCPPKEERDMLRTLISLKWKLWPA